jgi:hypothetical protein
MWYLVSVCNLSTGEIIEKKWSGSDSVAITAKALRHYKRYGFITDTDRYTVTVVPNGEFGDGC